MSRKTICLTMIVKNEAHLIIDCFKMLAKYIKFDYWAINDNGSTDGTQDLIKAYFKEQGIPGELDETPWRDFAFNRTRAFEVAYKKTDYAFVWDADDEIWGDFKMPETLEADHYKFIFGNEGGTRYSRCQLFNNNLKWHYVGVLHEYPACLEKAGPLVDILGNYYFISGRRGARNKDPEKYLKDGLILEKAFKEAFEKKDPIYNRYCFYTAQSYNSCNHHEKAIEYYKKVLDLENWVQEKYVSCIEIYDQYDKLNRNKEGLFYLLESFKYDKKRIEGIYRLIKYYCINGPVEAAYAYYTMIADHYENHYVKENVSDYLFTKKEEYDFYLPYYMVIVSERVNRYDTCIKMLQMIFNQGYLLSGEWWVHNLFHNIQFAIPHMPDDLGFLESMLSYIEALKKRGVSLNSNNYKIVDNIIAKYRPLLVAPLIKKDIKTTLGAGCCVMLTVTTCKRFDLFEQTMNSILKNWLDLDKVDFFYCVDDNSSDEDRLKMQTQFPFFTYHMKSKEEKGHRESMNVIWSKLAEVKPEYWIHMEDDWVYFKKETYVTRAIAALEKYEGMGIHQVVFNREYGLMISDMERVNVAPLGPREEGLVLHIKADGVKGPNCAYWPHYSLQPSVCRASKILELGNYLSPNNFFERDYADKYNAKAYKTAFFDGIYSLHIGKQHWEKDGKNAYALNQVDQLSGVNTDTSIEVLIKETNEPLNGTMRDHLDAILQKIKSQTPFGLIRPSDGEYSILKDETLTNCDNWTFQKGGNLRKQLMNAVKTVDPNLYIGIPCNTCNKPWNCTDKIYNDFIERFEVPLEQRTYANIFGNSNWSRFTDFMKSYEKRFYLITSGIQPSDLPIKERYIIDSRLVNEWDKLAGSETLRLLNFIKDKKGQLICFSAGPLSKIWIPMCMKVNPENMYLDVGASLDIFTKGQTNRLYTNQGHAFSKEACMFRSPNLACEPKGDTITMSTTIPCLMPNITRNLIYLGVFFNKDYIELLRIFLVTAKLYSSLDSIDFLIFTSEDFSPEIQALSKLVGIPLLMKFFSFNSVHEASCARLFIFDYNEAMAYDKIMYLDTDIIVQGDLMNIFSDPIEDKIYGMKEGTIEHEIHGGWWFDFSTIEKNTVAMNGGILLFKASETMKKIFNEINAHIKEIKDTKKPMPQCADQPFVNYHFIKANKYDNKMLEKHGLIYCIDPPPPPSEPTPVVLCHFVWPIGNARHKMGRMKPHVTHILRHFREISGKRAFFETNLVGTSFRWGTNGGIRFEGNGILVTTWALGTYKWLGENSLMASWAGYDHFLRFNNDFSEYQSLRLGDLEYTKGKRSMKFYDEHGKLIDTIRFETVEQTQADEYITEDCTVLELGARYGTVSCVINKKLKNPLNQVSVEPDNIVWKCLEKNIKDNGCNFHLIKGVVSRVPLTLTEHPVFVGYGNQTVKSEKSSLPNYTVETIEQTYNLKFDTLVADCEGFLGQFFEENPHMYNQLKLVIFEKDSPGTCDYSVILEKLKKHGFTNLVTGFHEVWKKTYPRLDLLEVYEFNNKVRCGQNSDGGYVFGELESQYDCYISAGVSAEESFSRDFINKYGLTKDQCFAFDGTIVDYPYHYTNKITFIKKNINSFNDDQNTDLSFLTDKYSSIFLKIDIEGGEYPWLLSLSQEALCKFKQIAIEFHGITDNTWSTSLEDKLICLEKLKSTHYLIHAHGNNYGKTFYRIPGVIELTYVNKSYFKGVPELNSDPLPMNLDFSNSPFAKDFDLNLYPFVNCGDSSKGKNALNVFTQIYETGAWGNNGNPEYKGSSGDGSFVEKNQEYIALLKDFIRQKEIKSVCDLGCGDWKCGNLIYDDLPIRYNGYDAYGKLVDYNQNTFASEKYSFKQLDFLNLPEEIKQADLCIIKDVLQHWPLDSIYKFLDTICNSKKFKYILVTNCSYQNNDDTDIPMGQFRPLSKDFLPLKKYNPVFLLSYQSKEVILLEPRLNQSFL